MKKFLICLRTKTGAVGLAASKMPVKIVQGLIVLTLLAVPPVAMAQEEKADAIRQRVEERGGSFFNFVLENDLFVGRDDGFTNGVSIAYGRVGFDNFTNKNTPYWMRALTGWLPIAKKPFRTRGVSHTFFQRLQTPMDITIAEFVPDDLPYAGLLAYQGSLFSSDTRQAEELSLILGLVGPTAFGEQSQSEIHALIGSDDPEGWDFQVRDTPVFQIDYRRIWSLLRTRTRTQFEVLGLGSVGIGNLESSLEAGFALRVGANLSRSLTAFDLKADRQVNPLAFGGSGDWYGFAGARVGVVGNDILVEGDLPDGLETEAELENFRSEFAAGVGYGAGAFAFVFQVAADSVLIEQQTGFDTFGALSLTYRY